MRTLCFAGVFSVRLALLERGRAIANGHSVCLSVCLSLRHTLRGSRYRDKFRTIP